MNNNLMETMVQDLDDAELMELNDYFKLSSLNRFKGRIDSKFVHVTRPVFETYMQFYGNKRLSIVAVEEEVDAMVTPPADVPQCSAHYHEMVYDDKKGIWACPNFQCGKMVRRVLNIDGTEGPVFKSDIGLFTEGTGSNEKFYLYIENQGIFIDVTDVVNRDSSGTMHGSPIYHLAFTFPELHNKD